ncbi:hypothetical protein BN938_0502 [Mucinivorans hirudinis]|uniref:MecI family transcriptional regulator n=1 Tax=Mucinivorans hirudinis TaxID=1433126 RepID=A0A060R9G5_9BACT|nr:MecI family transcriptional regulator [Mucinivorans hirudinis]CDN30388.1 hypothetical protein BN938_0282 [Mucinivorans hirudinis]CDN30607.1 hypothetical protein BN938_0502 [Mucinivorans hirudinis]
MRRELKTNELTRAELEIMQAIWELGECFLGEITEAIAEPKPAYNTVASTLKVLVNKGYVGYRVWNKSHQYFAVLRKDDYRATTLRHTLGRFFDNSPAQLVAFLNDSGTLTNKEYEDLREIARQIVESKK